MGHYYYFIVATCIAYLYCSYKVTLNPQHNDVNLCKHRGQIVADS